MIDRYFWPTGNGKKMVILLEELGIPYTIKPINIGRGDQGTRRQRASAGTGLAITALTDHPGSAMSRSHRRSSRSSATREVRFSGGESAAEE